MLPSWTRGMRVRVPLLLGVCAGAVAVVWLASESLGQRPEGPSQVQAPRDPVKPPSTEPEQGNPKDAPLPKSAAKAGQGDSQSPKEARPISLIEAITIVE